ncbi:MAG: Spy/CpxP family protein refolding chaperone [Polyangiales bacterium]
MFGFLIGTACLIGLIATIKRARWAAYHGGYGYGGGCGSYGGGGCGSWRGHHGWGGHHGHRGGWGGYREENEERGPRGFRGGFRGGPLGMFRFVSERLDLTPAQEKVVRQSMEEVREVFAKHRGTLKDSRHDIAKAIRASSFDAVMMGDLFGKHDSAIEDVRKAVVGALSRVHDALDEKQRERLAEMLEGGWW